jgi:hypothetical protein
MPREQPGRNLSTAQAVSGTQVARAWLGLCYGTWEPVALNEDGWLVQPSGTAGLGLPARPSKGDPQAVDQQEAEYRRQRTGTDHLVVAVKPGNAGRAKGVGRPGQLWLANHCVGGASVVCPQPGTAARMPRAGTPRGVRPVL